jgi:DNA-binding transcriptional regulator YiaG
MSEYKEKPEHGKGEGVGKTFGGKILDTLNDFADALEKGEVTERFTCRQVKLNLKPQNYSPKLVKETRRVLGVSQSLFARFLGVSPKTVHSWEQGINSPSKMACRFMDEIRRSPEHWRKRLQQVTVPCDGGGSEN